MLGWDRRLESWIATHRIATIDAPVRWLTEAGTVGAIWIAIVALLALRSRRLQLFLAVACADLVADLSTRIVQALIGRHRPTVSTLIPRPHSSSFPSGHAATSFACATVIAALSPALRAPAFALAALIALSRLYVGVHYPLDALGGAVYGCLVGLAVLRLTPIVSGAIARRRSHGR